MNTRTGHTLSLLALATAGMLGASSAASAASIGHYETCSGTGNAAHATAITAAGHTPVNVDLPNAATLAPLRALFVTNCSNDAVGAEYLSQMPAITAAVNAGMALIVHDRSVSTGASMLPGSGAITFVRDFEDDINIDLPAGSPLASGPGGVITNTTLDNGSSSTHGYVVASSLPAGARVAAHRTLASEAVTFNYGHGAGRVVYSTIPLDYYFAGATPVAFRTVYAPNVIAYALSSLFTTCAAAGMTGPKLTLCRSICEVTQPSTTLTNKIRLYTAIYRETPPCGL